VLAVVVQRRRVQLRPNALHEVVHFALRNWRDDEEGRARVESALSANEGEAEVECRVVEEGSRAEQDDGEFDSPLQRRPFPVYNLGDDLRVLFPLEIFLLLRTKGVAPVMFEEAEDEDEN
jgi:hypothetical protein